uniref:Uncharacterized protein n=1 Tax=Anopheles quadriannulatus TaxID=34691 RepID=A0A182XQ71_ANOQN
MRLRPCRSRAHYFGFGFFGASAVPVPGYRLHGFATV